MLDSSSRCEALIGIGSAIAVSLFWPQTLKVSQALWDRLNANRAGAEGEIARLLAINTIDRCALALC